MSTNVKKGQTWRSLRSGDNGIVNAVKNFHGGGAAAQLLMTDCRLRWVTIGKGGIIGYRLVKDAP